MKRTVLFIAVICFCLNFFSGIDAQQQKRRNTTATKVNKSQQSTEQLVVNKSQQEKLQSSEEKAELSAGCYGVKEELSKAAIEAARRSMVIIAPASRVENIDSPPSGLPDQSFQNVTFTTPLTTSLVTVANRGGTGNGSFLVTAFVSGGGFFSFQVKEDHDDVTLPLVQPIPITGVSIRCDSFSAVVCRYTVSLVGN